MTHNITQQLHFLGRRFAYFWPHLVVDGLTIINNNREASNKVEINGYKNRQRRVSRESRQIANAVNELKLRCCFGFVVSLTVC